MSNPAARTLEGAPGGVVPLFLPRPAQLFERRASRFRELARGHAIGDYLEAMAALCEAQRTACEGVPVAPLSPDTRLERPLSVDAPVDTDAVCARLDPILSAMKLTQLPRPARGAVARLEAESPEAVGIIAGALLARTCENVDPAAAPFVGAALQVLWTTRAAALAPAQIPPQPHGCPVCGSPPVAAKVLGDEKLRYLLCSLCGTEWHLTRLFCATCGAPDQLSYFNVEGDTGAVKAEACGRCHTYLKLFYLDKSPWAEPFADDLATLALDLMVAAEGFARSPNFFLASR